MYRAWIAIWEDCEEIHKEYRRDLVENVKILHKRVLKWLEGCEVCHLNNGEDDNCHYLEEQVILGVYDLDYDEHKCESSQCENERVTYARTFVSLEALKSRAIPLLPLLVPFWDVAAVEIAGPRNE